VSCIHARLLHLHLFFILTGPHRPDLALLGVRPHRVLALADLFVGIGLVGQASLRLGVVPFEFPARSGFVYSVRIFELLLMLYWQGLLLLKLLGLPAVDY
jgi:hypothetical protein